jgi:hypothetical protein
MDELLELAQRVCAEAQALGIPTAIIGGLALAHHGYVRATIDVDLASATSFDGPLRRLAEQLRARGLHVDVRAPDVGDPLAGVLRVRATPDGDPVDLVNFRPSDLLGRRAVEHAETAADGFRYVGLAELVALKLYAGSRFDLDDVARVLEVRTDAELAEVRVLARAVGLEALLDRALAPR